MQHDHQHTHHRHELGKTVLPMQAWALAVGAIIGWGCFILPGTRFLPDSGPLASLIGLAVGGLALCIVALCYGIMIKGYPVAGGAFAYAFVGLGRLAAVVCGWGLALSYSCVISLNATAILLLTRFLLPGAFETGHLYSIAGWNVYAGEIVLISLVILFFAFMNYRGSNCANTVQLWLSLSLAAGVVALAVGSGIDEGAGTVNLMPLYNNQNGLFVSIISVAALAPFLYQGFDTIPQTAEEFNFSHDKSTMLMVISIVCGCVLYSLVLAAVAIIRPYPELLAADHPWLTGAVAGMAFGKWGGIILAVPVLAGIFSGMNGYFIASTRILFSMGRSKFIPAWFERIHPEHKTPVNAILFVLLFSLLAPWFGRPVLVWLTDTCALSAALSYFFTCYTAYRYSVRHADRVTLPFARQIAFLGCGISVVSFFLLAVPGSPAAISAESWGLLLVWCVLGVLFYRRRADELKAISTEQLQYMLLGDTARPLLFTEGKIFR